MTSRLALLPEAVPFSTEQAGKALFVQPSPRLKAIRRTPLPPIFAAAFLLTQFVLADDPDPYIASRIPRAETGSERDHLTGDWGGWRTRGVRRGVHFSAGYTGEVLANVHGGIERGAVYEGLFEAALDLDLQTMGAWQNGLFHLSSLYPHGQGLTAKHVGDLGILSNIDAYDTFHLFEFW